MGGSWLIGKAVELDDRVEQKPKKQRWFTINKIPQFRFVFVFFCVWCVKDISVEQREAQRSWQKSVGRQSVESLARTEQMSSVRKTLDLRHVTIPLGPSLLKRNNP